MNYLERYSMAAQITKRQHQVPQFYIRLWADKTNQVNVYDLGQQIVARSGSKGILFDEFYYEEDPANPDNRIESILGEMETGCAPILRALNDTTNKYQRSSESLKLKKEIEQLLTPDSQAKIKNLAAFQYLRIPGAIDQKKYELQGSSMQKNEIDYSLNPGRFVESGYHYLKDRFNSLKMLVNYAFDGQFLTSDWPCFDMRDSDDAPHLGEDIGSAGDVVACMTLGPRMRVIFFPSNYLDKPGYEKAPPLIVKQCPYSQVKNHNVLIIQQAIRYVISGTSADYVFKVAAKRKRNRI